MKFIALRYFNAAGATERCGEDHRPESHLIPNVLAAALDPEKSIRVFGNNYPTPDGTPIRDYIHVTDLAEAHIAALHHLRKGRDRIAESGHRATATSVLEAIASRARLPAKQFQ